MAPPARQKRKRDEYQETPDYGSVFQRPDNDPPRPNFTGNGVMSQDTLNEILQADGQFQISLWTIDRDGKPLKNRDGTRRFRIHIEPPYDESDSDAGTNQDDGPADDDIPF